MTKYAMSVWGDLIVVRMDGGLEARSYSELEKKISDNSTTGVKTVLNMENIDFVDSQGVCFLLRMRDLVQRKGGVFAIYNMKPYVERVIRRLKLERILNVYWSAEECFIDMAEMDEEADNYAGVEESGMNIVIERIPEAVGGIR